MTINNMASMYMANRAYGINSSNAASSLGKLASGYKINSAADNAAGLAVSEKLRGLTTGLSTAETNAQNGVSVIQTAEGALSSSADTLTRMKELATQASNGTYSDSDRAALNKEFTQLKESLNQVSSSTNYNGQKLLDGSLADKGMTLQVGAQGSKDSQVNFKIGDMSAAGLGLDNNINISSMDGASNALKAIDSAINSVSSTRGDLGATQNGLNSTINNLSETRINAVKSESNIRDLDMAEEIMNFTRQSIMSQASTAMMAQTMNLMRQNMMSLLVR